MGRTDSKEVILQPLTPSDSDPVSVCHSQHHGPLATHMEGFGVPRGDRLTTPTSPTTCSHCPPQPACAYGDPQNVASPTAPLAGPANGRPRPSSSVQFSPVLSPVQLSATPCTAACQASLSITNSCSLPKLMSTESVIPSNHLTLCHPLLLPPSIFPRIRVFSNESALPIRWPKDWVSASKSVLPMNTQD